jgi:iron(II)-dependent oxidoreductase
MSVEPFSIATRPVLACEFAEFADSREYADPRHWSDAGNAWRDQILPQRQTDGEIPHAFFAAMHVNYYEADAWCNWAGRRLPTEAEWEFAVTHSEEFLSSTGHVWEWCATEFAPYPGFSPARYRDYSAPWFYTHQVLKGGSFATHARLKYPQYRNFYTKERRDMFCGFRTCALR